MSQGRALSDAHTPTVGHAFVHEHPIGDVWRVRCFDMVAWVCSVVGRHSAGGLELVVEGEVEGTAVSLVGGGSGRGYLVVVKDQDAGQAATSGRLDHRVFGEGSGDDRVIRGWDEDGLDEPVDAQGCESGAGPGPAVSGRVGMQAEDGVVDGVGVGRLAERSGVDLFGEVRVPGVEQFVQVPAEAVGFPAEFLEGQDVVFSR